MKLAIGDKLLIMQTSTVRTTPWQYRLIYLPTLTTVASETGITDDYKLVTLSSTVYGDYEGKSLLLEILNNSSVLIEDDVLLISGAYGKLDEMKLLVGLLGENAKHVSSASGDFQDGHEKHKDIEIYTTSSMAIELASYDWTQSFVTDFTPDARYQTKQILQSKD